MENHRMRKSSVVLVSMLACALAACGDDGAGSGGSGGAGASGATGGTGNAGAGGSGGQGGDGTGGIPDPVPCLECVSPAADTGGACETVYADCENDTACADWLDCFESCALANYQQSCFDDCNTEHAAAAALYDPLLVCECGECATLCGPICPTQ
jgi:hypothetical protein